MPASAASVMSITLRALLLALLLTLSWAGPTRAHPTSLVIVGARLLDNQGLRSPQTVLLQQGKIVQIGPCSIPSGAQVIQAQGQTLLPGFFDAHVHLALSDPAACLRGGTTTVRDLGWDPQILFPRQPGLRAQGPYLLASMVGPEIAEPGSRETTDQRRPIPAPVGGARPAKPPTLRKPLPGKSRRERPDR